MFKDLINKIFPTKGMSENIKISIFGKEGIVLPIKGAPAKPVRPMANIVKPKPVATWFVIKLIVNKQNIDAINAPHNAPATIPKYGFPSHKTTANPPTAPLNIIPSTPRFKIPLFSVISSPVAASNNGIEVAIIVKINASSTI